MSFSYDENPQYYEESDYSNNASVEGDRYYDPVHDEDYFLEMQYEDRNSPDWGDEYESDPDDDY